MVRSVALDVIGVLGTAAEVKQVEAIIHEAREVDFEKVGRIRRYLERSGYEQIREKGQRIIKQIRRRSVIGEIDEYERLTYAVETFKKAATDEKD